MAAKHYSQPWVKLMKGMKQAFPEGTSPRVYPSAPKIQAFTRDFKPGVEDSIKPGKGYGTESKNVNPFEASAPFVFSAPSAPSPPARARRTRPEPEPRERVEVTVEQSRAHQRNKRSRGEGERPRKAPQGLGPMEE